MNCFLRSPFNISTLVSYVFVVQGGPQIYQYLTSNGVAIGGDAAKSDKKTNLLVIMCVRLSQKISLLNLKNRT